MPSLFDFVKRMAKGEPVFQQSDADSTVISDQPDVSQSVPEAVIVREDCYLDGNTMTCEADIQNLSDQTLFVDEVIIFGRKTELQRQLRPGERREFRIYDGPAISGNYINDCYVLYRDETGDYFRSNHDVDCEEQADGHQFVKRIRFVPPVKDV